MIVAVQPSRGATGVCRGHKVKKTESERLLTAAQEKELVKFIDCLTTKGLLPTRQMIRNFAS